MTDSVQRHLRPWQVQDPRRRDVGSSDPSEPSSEGIVDDVLELAHGGTDDAEKIRFKKSDFRTALARLEAVEINEDGLSLAGTRFPLTTAQKQDIALLEPNQRVIAGVWAGMHSSKPTLVSAPTGSGSTHTIRWLLDVVGVTHSHARLTRMTSVDALVGALRPDADGKPRVQSGPLTQRIQEGGVFLAENIDQADKDVMALLKTLAKGARYFQHPVSGKVIPVHKDFRLVLVGDSRKRVSKDLLAEANLIEVRSYTQEEHARLLCEKHDTPPELAQRLADFHKRVQDDVEAGELDFGRGFPVQWNLLSRVGARLRQQPGEVVEALWGTYGDRLTNPNHREHFAELMSDWGVRTEAEPTLPPDSNFTLLDCHRRPLASAQKALAYGEALLLRVPGQGGATRIAHELAEQQKQQLVTVVCHAGVDPQGLMERPLFNEDGTIQFQPGVIADALIHGKMLYFDHVDHLSTERQSALFRLQQLTSIKIVENGEVVEKPIHPKARLIFSATEGTHRSRNTPSAEDRALLTEVVVERPTIDDAIALIPSSCKKPVRDLVEQTARRLHEEDPECGVLKLQRFIDFARAAEVLSAHLSPEHAVARAASMLFHSSKSKVIKQLLSDVPEEKGRPVWMRLLGLTPKQVDARLKETGYRLVPSMEPLLEPLAVAYQLGRPVLAVGPASSGKTVLGAIWSALVQKSNIRVNFSASTEARDLKGGLGPVNVDGRTLFRQVNGPEFDAAEMDAVLTADEMNLSPEAYVALKSWVDHRRTALDSDAGTEAQLGTAFLYAAQNPLGTRGRQELAPIISDCMFHLVVNAKPLEEKVDIVASQCDLDKDNITNIARFYEDLEILAAKNRFESAVGPITCTERDMLKAARTAHHLITRDGVRGKEEKQKIVGREVYRQIRDLLQSDEERDAVFEGLIKKHFGDVEPPQRPTGLEQVERTIDGKRVRMLRIGVAEFPIGDADIPKPEHIREPVGEQFEFLESILLSLELDQPVAAVGDTGTGKTMLMRYLAYHLRQRFREQAFHGDMTEDDIFGTTVLRDDGRVEFQESPLVLSALHGDLYCGDEFLTLHNQVRESTNAVTEGSEIQVPSKPPRTLRKHGGPKEDRWDPRFRMVFTTNGDDIREDGFSDPEASRLRIVALRELQSYEDLLNLALRDYAVGEQAPYERPKRTKESRKAAAAAVMALVGSASTFGKQLARAFAGEPFEDNELDKIEAPSLTLSDAATRALADALNVHGYPRKDAATRTLISALLGACKNPQACTHILSWVPNNSVTNDVLQHANEHAVVDGKLLSSAEVEKATRLFVALRKLQQSHNAASASPLTPRLFTAFMEYYVSKRQHTCAAEAAMGAAQLAWWSKMPADLEKKAVALLVEQFGQAQDTAPADLLPRITKHEVNFGHTRVGLGNEVPWEPNNLRFPMTMERIKNLALIADSVAMGRGRPISCTDDDNGETLECLREFAHLTGRRITVLTLPPNVDVESLIEKLSLTDDPNIKSGFAPELQQIGQAIKEGHLLVLRGCGNIPSNKLERLNSLGDGRQGVECPRSGKWLKAHDAFRMVLMRRANAPFQYSPALENRLIEPLLSTRDTSQTKEALDLRAAELAAVVHKKTTISEEAALKLAAFHTYLNQIIRQGGFAAGRSVGSFINRDAEAVGRRLKWLQDRGAVTDELETLHHLVMQVYGERFDPASDRLLLGQLIKRAFGTEGSVTALSQDLTPTQHLMRCGDWAVARDPRGLRDGVPGADAVLPFTQTLAQTHQKLFAALQFGETVHLHGDSFVAQATANSVARLTCSPIQEVEGYEEMSEAHLFGGLVQNDKGKFEPYEGLVWQAQKEGGTLLIRNASRIPQSILTRLQEIAATGDIQRIRDGKLEIKPRNFRLILQTSPNDPPLVSELASVCTKIRCESITDPRDLEQLVGHILRRVPGGADIAKALVTFSTQAADALSTEALVSRQTFSFDSERLLLTASQIADGYAANKELATQLADALSRAYLRPVQGLEIEAKLGELIDQLADTIYGGGGFLVAETISPIDLVRTPQLASLKQDYDHVAGSFTSAVLQCAGDALSSAAKKAKTKQTLQLLDTLLATPLMPKAVKARLLGLRERLKTVEKRSFDEAIKQELADTVASIQRRIENAESFGEHALDFVRGARLWDLEHRLEILSRYKDLFTRLEGAGAVGAGEHLGHIARVQERFDTASAMQTIQTARSQVSDAIRSYQNRQGEADETAARLFRRVLQSWDLVTTTPIFANHHLLRAELAELNGTLDEFACAHGGGSRDSEEVRGLVEALQKAGEVLEGARIAEQSAELRRDLARASTNTKTLVQSLREELAQVHVLSAAKEQHDRLKGVARFIEDVLGTGDFLHLQIDGDGLSRPDGRSEESLQREARKEAAKRIAPEIAQKRTALFSRLQSLSESSSAPAPGEFFKDYDLQQADVGLGVDAPNAIAKSAVEKAYQEGIAEIESFKQARIKQESPAIVEELKAEDDKRAANEYKDKIRARAHQLAAKVDRSARDLLSDLNNLLEWMPLEEDNPQLYAKVKDARAELHDAAARAAKWANQMAAWLNSAGQRVLRFFGFEQPPAPDLQTPAVFDLEMAKSNVAGVLREVLTFVESKLASLPDTSGLEDHKTRASGLTDELLFSENLGELSSRFSALVASSEQEQQWEVKRILTTLMGRMSSDRDAREMLQRVAAFSDSADTLSSSIAAVAGVSVEVAPVVESIMRAAQSLRSQSLSEKSFKASIKALQYAIGRIDDLEDHRGSIPQVLAAVRTEMSELIDALREVAHGGGAVYQQTAAISEMLNNLAEADRKARHNIEEHAAAFDDPQDDIRTKSEGGEDLEMTRPLEASLEQAAQPSHRLADLERPIRETQLKTITIDFTRADDLVQKINDQNDKEPDQSEEATARRQRFTDLVAQLRHDTQQLTAGIEGDNPAAELLGHLERALNRTAVDAYQHRLTSVTKLLESICAAEGHGYRGLRTDIAAAVEQLRGIVSELHGIQEIPAQLTASLSGIVDSARPLGAAFTTDGLAQLAQRWAGKAREVAHRVQGELVELGGKLETENRDDFGVLLKDLNTIVESQGTQHVTRLGAWSRFTLLSHIHQRLNTLHKHLPEPSQEQAKRILSRAQELAAKQYQISGGRYGEQAAIDLYDSLIDLAEAQLKRKRLCDEEINAFEELCTGVITIIGPVPEEPAQTLDVIARAIDTAQKLQSDYGKRVGRAAREVDRCLASMRSAIFRNELDTIEARFGEVSTTYLSEVRDARLDLRAAMTRFVEYDPSKEEATISELARELKNALVDANALMKGPAAVLLARDIQQLNANLEGMHEQGAHGTEAQRLADELDPLLRGAKSLLETPDAPARFGRILNRIKQRLKRAFRGETTRKEIEWAAGAVSALENLIAAEHAQLPQLLADVERRFAPQGGSSARSGAGNESEDDTQPAVRTITSALANFKAGAGVSQSDMSQRSENRDGVVEALVGRQGGGDRPHPQAQDPSVLNVPGHEADPAAKKLDRDATLGTVDRKDIEPGEITELSDSIGPVEEIGAEELDAIRQAMEEEIAEAKAREIAGDEQRTLNAFEQFIVENEDLVDRLAQTLRQYPNTEVVIAVDQSGSVRNHFGDSRIIDQQRAAAALIMAAVMRGESNCAALGFNRAAFAPYKHMAVKMDANVANVAYGKFSTAGGGTNLIAPLDAAIGQFTDKANNKLVVMLTDCNVGGGSDIQRKIQTMRDAGIGVAVIGFGAAQHVQTVAGDYGMHVNSYAGAIEGAGKLFAKTVVDNGGRFRGKIKADAGGVGVSTSQAPILPAASAGPMDSSLRISQPLSVGGDPAQVYATKGKRRELLNLVERSVYERTLKQLEHNQSKVHKSDAYRRCLQEVRELRNRHDREGVVEGLREAVSMSLPRSGGTEWERKQVSGPLLDEDQLPMYVVGLEQGVPVVRIFKRKKAREELRAKVVLSIDESSSMGDSDKMRANVEAMLAYGDALKAVDPDIEIAVLGFSDHVRLHAGFEQEWNDELKAHLLHQARGEYDATDNERGGAEAVSLLHMIDADVGQVVSFSDGQGMPGAKAVMKQAGQEGFSFLTIGVGPECKAVMQFDEHGLYARNLSQMIQKIPNASIKTWEKAGRLVGGG